MLFAEDFYKADKSLSYCLVTIVAECRKRRLNQGSFVLLCFVLLAFSGLCLLYAFSLFLICLVSCIFQREWHCTA